MPELKKHKKDEIPKKEPTAMTAEAKAEDTLAPEKSGKKAPSKFSRFLGMVGVGILLVALGAAAFFLTVYLPQTDNLKAQIKAAQTEVAAANAEISAAKAEVTTAKTQIEGLKAVEAQLTQAKSDLVTLQGKLDKVSAQKSVYQIQSNVNTARIALLQTPKDSARAAQSLGYIIQNLGTLEVPAFPDITKNLGTRLTDINTTITTDPTKALSDLEALFNDLVLLADNIK